MTHMWGYNHVNMVVTMWWFMNNVYLLPFGGVYLYFLILLQRTYKIKIPMRQKEKNTKAT